MRARRAASTADRLRAVADELGGGVREPAPRGQRQAGSRGRVKSGYSPRSSATVKSRNAPARPVAWPARRGGLRGGRFGAAMARAGSARARGGEPGGRGRRCVGRAMPGRAHGGASRPPAGRARNGAAPVRGTRAATAARRRSRVAGRGARTARGARAAGRCRAARRGRARPYVGDRSRPLVGGERWRRGDGGCSPGLGASGRPRRAARVRARQMGRPGSGSAAPAAAGGSGANTPRRPLRQHARVHGGRGELPHGRFGQQLRAAPACPVRASAWSAAGTARARRTHARASARRRARAAGTSHHHAPRRSRERGPGRAREQLGVVGEQHRLGTCAAPARSAGRTARRARRTPRRAGRRPGPARHRGRAQHERRRGRTMPSRSADSARAIQARPAAGSPAGPPLQRHPSDHVLARHRFRAVPMKPLSRFAKASRSARACRTGCGRPGPRWAG